MHKTSIRQLAASEKPLITPLAHDAMSARLIQRAGFKAMAIGGSALLAARYGLPDIGLAALGEMSDGIRDIVEATDLPLMVDGDDGYGDAKSVIRMMERYVRWGISGVVLEDQLLVNKQPGDSGATAVASVEVMVNKIKLAVETSSGTDCQIIARCDAYAVEGLQSAMRRAELYLKAGAQGLLIPGLKSIEELVEVGNHFRGIHLMVAQFEGRPTWLPPAQLYEMGYRHITLPGLLIQRMVHCMDEALQGLSQWVQAAHPMPEFPIQETQLAFNDALRFNKWNSF